MSTVASTSGICPRCGRAYDDHCLCATDGRGKIIAVCPTNAGLAHGPRFPIPEPPKWDRSISETD